MKQDTVESSSKTSSRFRSTHSNSTVYYGVEALAAFATVVVVVIYFLQ